MIVGFPVLRAPPGKRERQAFREHLALLVLEGPPASLDLLAPKEPKEPQAQPDLRERRVSRALRDTRAPQAR